MEIFFKIFQIETKENNICYTDVEAINSEVFKYQENKGFFKNYADAREWLKGLSILKGNFVIFEVFLKKTTLPNKSFTL